MESSDSHNSGRVKPQTSPRRKDSSKDIPEKELSAETKKSIEELNEIYRLSVAAKMTKQESLKNLNCETALDTTSNSELKKGCAFKHPSGMKLLKLDERINELTSSLGFTADQLSSLATSCFLPTYHRDLQDLNPTLESSSHTFVPSRRFSKFERDKALKDESERKRIADSKHFKRLLKETNLGKRWKSKQEKLRLFGVPLLEDSPQNLARMNPKGRFGNKYRLPALSYYEPDLDPRLQALGINVFKGKKVLDLGCGDGRLCLEIANAFQPHKVKGIDLDSNLIKKALDLVRHGIPKTYSLGIDHEEVPKSLQYKLNKLQKRRCMFLGIKNESDGKEPQNDRDSVTFELGNFLRKEPQIEGYDVILCLSTTKWIQINWGDHGMFRLFEIVHKGLRTGGRFVVDFSRWASFKKIHKNCQAFKVMYSFIRIKPEDLNSRITRHGFELEKVCEGEYSKPLYIYKKMN